MKDSRFGMKLSICNAMCYLNFKVWHLYKTNGRTSCKFLVQGGSNYVFNNNNKHAYSKLIRRKPNFCASGTMMTPAPFQIPMACLFVQSCSPGTRKDKQPGPRLTDGRSV